MNEITKIMLNCNRKKEIKKVVESEEFYFQKLRDKLTEFKNYEISDEDVEMLIYDAKKRI